jgi:hypothetical protein
MLCLGTEQVGSVGNASDLFGMLLLPASAMIPSNLTSSRVFSQSLQEYWDTTFQ